jgi:hypothetical protein
LIWIYWCLELILETIYHDLNRSFNYYPYADSAWFLVFLDVAIRLTISLTIKRKKRTIYKTIFY